MRGAKPADLPVEQPTKVDLVINLTTAKVLGITIPEPLLLRADAAAEFTVTHNTALSYCSPECTAGLSIKTAWFTWTKTYRSCSNQTRFAQLKNFWL